MNLWLRLSVFCVAYTSLGHGAPARHQPALWVPNRDENRISKLLRDGCPTGPLFATLENAYQKYSLSLFEAALAACFGQYTPASEPRYQALLQKAIVDMEEEDRGNDHVHAPSNGNLHRSAEEYLKALLHMQCKDELARQMAGLAHTLGKRALRVFFTMCAPHLPQHAVRTWRGDMQRSAKRDLLPIADGYDQDLHLRVTDWPVTSEHTGTRVLQMAPIALAYNGAGTGTVAARWGRLDADLGYKLRHNMILAISGAKHKHRFFLERSARCKSVWRAAGQVARILRKQPQITGAIVVLDSVSRRLAAVAVGAAANFYRNGVRLNAPQPWRAAAPFVIQKQIVEGMQAEDVVVVTPLPAQDLMYEHDQIAMSLSVDLESFPLYIGHFATRLFVQHRRPFSLCAAMLVAGA